MNKLTFLQKLRTKPHNLLLFACAVLILLSFVEKENNSFDFHLHDTYFVVGAFFFHWLLAIVTWVLWLLYIPIKKCLYSATLTWVHVIASVSVILLFGFILSHPPTPAAHHFVDYSRRDLFDRPNNLTGLAKTLIILILVLLLAQLVFITNIVWGLIKRKKNLLKSSQS